MEHDIALPSAENERNVVGRLQFFIEFQHVQTTSVNLGSIKFEFDGKHEHNYYFKLQAQTSDSTIDSEVKCHNIKPVYESDLNRTILQISGTTAALAQKLPGLSFHTTYSQLNASCLKISLWAEPEKPLQTPHTHNSSAHANDRPPSIL